MSLRAFGRQFVDAGLEATVVGSFSNVGYAARRRLFAWDTESFRDMSGRVAVVTGASGGLGLAATKLLARRGCKVWLVGRDETRANAAADAVASDHPDARVEVALADFAALEDVRRLADAISATEHRLDVLIHNAGALNRELRITENGLELTAQVHVVAPFLLTVELLPLLRHTSASRVITVSSGGMYVQPLDLPKLAVPPQPFHGARVYANAKRAQVVLNERWARSGAANGVSFYAMHPGWVRTAGLREGLPRFYAAMRPLLRTPYEGADTIMWLAAGDLPKEASGRFFFDRHARAVSPLPGTRTTETAAGELWRWCADRAGVAPEPEAVS